MVRTPNALAAYRVTSRSMLFALTLVGSSFTTPAAQAQRDSYQAAFRQFHDAHRDTTWGLYDGDSHNRNAGFVWGKDYAMQAYVTMAQATELLADKKTYMNTAIAHFEWILAHRDDRDRHRVSHEFPYPDWGDPPLLTNRFAAIASMRVRPSIANAPEVAGRNGVRSSDP